MARFGSKASLLVLLVVSPALAQQQPDPAFLQKAIIAMQAQRNAAQDSAAAESARAAMLADEVARLNAELDKLRSEPPK